MNSTLKILDFRTKVLDKNSFLGFKQKWELIEVTEGHDNHAAWTDFI